MKILILNPTIDAGHSAVAALKAKGVALFLPADTKEGEKLLKLHEGSVDLLIIHREVSENGASDVGIRWAEQLRSNPTTSDLPIILTTDQWGETECSNHQSTPEGLNAYLPAPFSDEQVIDTIEGILGPIDEAIPSASSPQSSSASNGDLRLQDIGEVQTSRETSAELSIQLDAHDSDSINEKGAVQKGSAQPDVVPSSEDAEGVNLSMDSSDDAASLQLTPDTPLSDQKSESESFELDLDAGTGGDGKIPSPEEMASILDAPAPTEGEEDQHEPTAMLSIEESRAGMEALAELTGASISKEPSPSSPLEPSMDLEPGPGSRRGRSEEKDPEAEQEMPYLWGKKAPPAAEKEEIPKANLMFVEPVGDAVVPGGAAQAPDLETFKKYLLLREQDVAILSSRLKASQEEVANLEKVLREEKAKTSELTHSTHEQKQKIEDFEKEKQRLVDQYEEEIKELNFQLKSKADRARLYESRAQESSEEMDHLKERIRSDIRKIRMREKELENQLEIVKKDSEALMTARESKIIELKRRLDLLEFNMDLLQDQYNREKDKTSELKERLAKAAQIVRVARGLLEPKSAGAPNDRDDADSEAEGSTV